ncbi:Transforming protein v-Fos/v-Fox [Armadillidium nasatum]|uniref:Transforming protein v-Fos/v-Fox n=1 Tax=Armadillidium nasatum TaxID=96803 RepID=A0A5N5SP28_9CRUS|nr:Transforming protein v-Fos/v-Fox [Armadillidium nasatum]
MSPNGGLDPGGGHSGTYVFARVSGVFKGVPTTPGTPSPPVPELKSPVNTVEATKSALIKEGLKIQIKSKLLSAGVEPNEILSETKYVKEEVSDSQELTPQDEERRMRRRERNKIAATKCRNKKKEKTVILMTESESVEDQNHRLKSEIQRLTNEKLKLEKLLEDPSHVASCRHSCSRGTHNPLVITSPDAPEQLLPSSSSEGIQTSTVITDSTGSEVVSSMPYCSPSAIPSSWDSSFSSSDSLSPSYVNLSPSTISPLSLPNVSPPHLVTSSHNIPPHTSPHSVNTYLPPAGSCSPYTTDAGSFVNLSPPTDITVTPSSLSLPTTEPPSDHNHESLGTSTSTTYLNPKAPKMQTNKRPQPYSIPRSSRIQTYQTDGSVGSYSQDLLGCRLFGYTSLTSDNDISSHDPFLHPNSSNEYLPNTSPPYKVRV